MRQRRTLTLAELAATYSDAELEYQRSAAKSHKLDFLVAVLDAEIAERARRRAETQKAASDELGAA